MLFSEKLQNIGIKYTNANYRIQTQIQADLILLKNLSKYNKFNL